MPIEWRLAAIGVAAVVLLGFGWRLRLSRPGYAQVLQGGAVAVLYLTCSPRSASTACSPPARRSR